MRALIAYRRRCAILLLTLLAVWQLGNATYIHAKARLAQYLLEHAWQRTAGAADRIVPWPWADTWPVARLTIPHLHRSLIVLSDASGRALAFAPGLVNRDSLSRTDVTNVIAGHRDTHFAVLRELAIGDRVSIEYADRRPLFYQVTSTRIIDIRDQRLLISDHGSELILTTCYPFDAIDAGGPLRYLVVLVPEANPVVML